jgi:glycosyltransferase involved in cell wall biosynthesis
VDAAAAIGMGDAAAAVLRQVLWAGRAEDTADRLAAAGGAAALAGAAADALDPPADLRMGAAEAAGRLRRLALALLAAGEHRLQAALWEAALRRGLDPLHGHQRLLDAAHAAGDGPRALAAGAWLLDQPQPRPHWQALTRSAAARVLDGSAAGAVLVLRLTGPRFLPEVLQATAAEALAGAAGDLPPGTAVLVAAALAARGAEAAARRLAAALAGGETAAAAVADALCDLAAGRLDAVHAALEGLPADPGDDLLLPAALAAAGAAHAALAGLAARAVRLPDALARLAALVTAVGAQADALAGLTAALAAAGLDRLAILDMRLGLAADLDPLQAQAAAALVEADTSDRRAERVLALARRLADSETTGAAAAAAFCRRHADTLAATPAGAALLARALTAVQDWEGSLAAWDAVLAQQPDAAWALGRAYHAAARAGQAARAAAYLGRTELDDPAAQPALLNLAYGACILGDLDTGARCLDRFDALPAEAPARQQDRFNLAGRLRAALSGDAGQLLRDSAAVAQVPPGAPPPRVLLIDPGFAVNDGHHFAYTLFATRFFAAEAGIDPAAVQVCTRIDAPLGEGAGEAAAVAGRLHRILAFNPYAFEEFPKSPRILGNIARAWQADLTRAFAGQDLDSVEAIYCHSMKASMAEGLAGWIAARLAGPSGGRRLAVILGIIEVDYMGEGAEATAACNAAYAAAVARLRALPGVQLVLYAETAHAVRELSAVLGGATPVHNIPYLAASLAGPAATAPVALSGGRVTVGLVGGSRRERGLDLFPELMLALADVPDLHWIVQMSRSLAEAMDPVFPAYLDWAVARGLCTWFDGRLETADYHAALRQMDVVLMPYRDRYAVSGSGVFYEAIELERYLVVPQDTFMAGVLRDWDYPCEIMAAASVPAALRALRRVLQRRGELAADMQVLRAAGGDRLPVGQFRRLVRAALAAVRG